MENPSHPGEVLAQLYLEPLGMSAIALAKRLSVPRTRIERLVRSETSLTVDTAMRLAKFFGNSRQSGWRGSPAMSPTAAPIRAT